MKFSHSDPISTLSESKRAPSYNSWRKGKRAPSYNSWRKGKRAPSYNSWRKGKRASSYNSWRKGKRAPSYNSWRKGKRGPTYNAWRGEDGIDTPSFEGDYPKQPTALANEQNDADAGVDVYKKSGEDNSHEMLSYLLFPGGRILWTKPENNQLFLQSYERRGKRETRGIPPPADATGTHTHTHTHTHIYILYYR